MAGRKEKASGAVGRTVAGAAAAVDPDFIDVNGERFSCLQTCVQCYDETEVVIWFIFDTST